MYTAAGIDSSDLTNEGKKEALVDLVMQNKDDYYKLAYSYMGNSNDAMDALQDMIVIVYKKIYQLKDLSSFTSWSKTILVNCCKDLLRRQKKTVSLDELFHNASEEILVDEKSSKALKSYIKSDINRAIMKLGSALQEVIRLRYFLDLDNETISSILNIPLGTVKSRLSASMKKLRGIMGGDYFED